eukprot:TRINITY_DN5704_c0_g1_i1.p1 TRINITY_DN5704_c0_g1~~TRINITY_DN5704_c0_g1_i1.p1  ORF type:complete len:224 (-),score=33.32 TRINITY_DN5704_c0_g1_i1:46-717(-)
MFRGLKLGRKVEPKKTTPRPKGDEFGLDKLKTKWKPKQQNINPELKQGVIPFPEPSEEERYNQIEEDRRKAKYFKVPQPYPRMKIQFRFSAYEPIIEAVTRRTIDAAHHAVGVRSQDVVAGHMPTILEKWTVNRSPHVDKKARDQFERRTHRRTVTVNADTSQLGTRFIRYVKDHMPGGVSVMAEIQTMYPSELFSTLAVPPGYVLPRKAKVENSANDELSYW